MVGVLALSMWPFGAAHAQAGSQQLYLQCLTNFEPYAESIWHTAAYPGAPPDAGYWGDGGSTGNGGIRGNSGIAVAYAVLVVAQPNDPRNPTRLTYLRQALNYDTATHVTGAYNTVSGNQWGYSGASGDWQTPMWAGSMGLACLLVQSNLPLQTVEACRQVVAAEATHRAGIAPASGYVGDTKAEENAWQGNILALAAAWMTNDPNASLWLTAAKKYLVNTYTVPDTNGDSLAAWVTTQTLYPSYSLENHGFYHPTYEMVAGMSSGDSLLMAQLADPTVAEELRPYAEHNVLTVWRTNLQYMVMEAGEFAYPAGLDWELHDYEQNSYVAWMAAHFDDPLARWTDQRLAQLVRYRQLVNGNGEFVGPSGGGFYREAVEARRTALAWLQWANADYAAGPTNAPGPAVVQFPDVEIIAQRSPWAFVSISYGSRIMGMIEPATASVPTNAYVATPALPGVFGVGPLGDPTSATLVSLTTNATGFAAQLRVQNGANGSTCVYVTSTGESVGIVEVPQPASGVTGSDVGCFTDGIENDPLTGGARRLEWSGGSNTVASFSGVAMTLHSPWVCVSGRYGVAAGPGAAFQYQTASGYNRPGAAQDLLSVAPQTRLGPRYCVWFPDRNAAQTAALAGQISWTTNGNTVVLTFPGAGGQSQTISAVLTPGDGTWVADADGNWSDASKWAGGKVADGAGATADFTTVGLTADRTVTLDVSRTVGIVGFGDPAGSQNWTLNSSNGSTLALSGSAPHIAVLQNTATINAPLAGTSGFTKFGPGTLVLSGTNSLSGPLYLDIGSGSASASSDGAVRITTSAALGNIAFLSIGNNTGSYNGSTLQLDGSSGGITVHQNLTASCRANTIPNLENLAGTNSFTGNLYMQTGGTNVVIKSDGGLLVLDGGLRYIGNLIAGRSFNFTGAGDTLVNGPILSSSVAPISVGKWGNGTLSLRGDNSFNGRLTVSGGTLNFATLSNLGSPSEIVLAGGTLQYAPGNASDISGAPVTIETGGATLDTGPNVVPFVYGIGNLGPGALTKTGSGVLTLEGANSYTGGTIVSNGTLRVQGSLATGAVTVAAGALGGAGIIGGPVTVQPPASLSPGGPTAGSLTINGTLTNHGTISVRLVKSATTQTNDTINCSGVFYYGGSLQLVPSGAPLTVGDHFKLFNAPAYAGAFASVTPATPGVGLSWDTNRLAADGTLSVGLGDIHPQFRLVAWAGTNLVWQGSGGAAAAGWSVLASTNLALPLTNWENVATGGFDTNGDFAFTNRFTRSQPQKFYLLCVP